MLRLRGTVLHRIYELPPLVVQGRIFYGLYLWHIPVYGLVDLFGFRDDLAMRTLLGIPLTYAAATISFFVVERYCMRTRTPGNRLAAHESAAGTTMRPTNTKQGSTVVGANLDVER
jgi:peptidoglycan/LPS O-acetylase OafA/YrhL